MKLFRAALVISCFLTLSATAAERFVSTQCHGSFAVPAGWGVHRFPHCTFGLRPKVWPPARPGDDRDFGENAIVITIARERFEDATQKTRFFRVATLRTKPRMEGAEPQRKPTDWVLLGSQAGVHDAHRIRAKTWFGVRGAAAISYYGKAGGNRGLDSVYRAVLSTGKWRAATISADNPFTPSEFDRVVRSFRFEP